MSSQIRYRIFDPTGNITALVESFVAIEEQPSLASKIMELHPEVEQVGFVSFEDGSRGEGRVWGSLRMAGGEFCGNATLSAAALCAIHRLEDASSSSLGTDWDGAESLVTLNVSGAARPVGVLLKKVGSHSFTGSVHMPSARAIEAKELILDGVRGNLFLVVMEGISHLVITPESLFFSLLNERERAERVVRDWCNALQVDGLGLMFVEGKGDSLRVVPLVYVPGSGTVFWESSCASGSSAVGMYLAKHRGSEVELSLHEPGGTLKVKSDHSRGETWLSGGVQQVGSLRKLFLG